MFLFFGQVFANVLNFSSYEEQVLKNNKFLIGLKNNIESYQKKQQESNLIFSPYLFANFYYSDDESEKLNPQFMGVATTVKNYELGVKQQTAWGQQFSLSYQAQYIGMKGTSLTSPIAYEVGPKLELTQSLWRNFFGSESRSQQALVKAQNAYTYYQELFQYQQLVRQAKLLYVQTYIAKESLRLHQESLKRAEEILVWAKKRSQRQLADESDYLQAQAQVLSKEYEVKIARENLSMVSKQFQTMRGLASESIEENLLPIGSEDLLNYTPVAEFAPQADFVAFKEQMELSKNQSILAAQKYKPTFELFGQLQYQGRDPQYKTADDEAWDKKNEWWVIGLRFMAPIYFLDAKDTISAYEMQEQTAELQLKQKEMESLSAWNNLKEQLIQNKEKLKISKKLLSIQKRKIEVEREKLKQGRTTTYQVLMFEIDYLNAELMNLKGVADLLQVTTELDLYKKM